MVTPPAGAVPAPIPLEVQAKLGAYVYALQNTQDGSVFYVGKGRGGRVYHHVWAAAGCFDLIEPAHDESGDRDRESSGKIRRIHDIWDAGHQVRHHIIRYGIEPGLTADDSAFQIEQALIDGLRIAQPDTLTNVQGGHVDTAHRSHTVEELVLRYSAEPVPDLPVPCALVRVNRASAAGITPGEMYEVSRVWWRAGWQARNTPDLPVLVFAVDIVREVYRARSWDTLDGKTWRFTGDVDADLHAKYVGRSLRRIRESR